jgi:hypothetical protein
MEVKTMTRWVGVLFFAMTLSFSASAASILSVEKNSEPADLQDALSQAARLDERCAFTGSCQSTESDKYKELEKLFAIGTLPTQSDVMGWRTGRCYMETNRLSAEPSLLAGVSAWVGGTDGPLFPPTENFKFYVLKHDAADANYFDWLTPSTESEINSVIQGNKASVKDACVKDDSLSVDYEPRTRWQLRLSGNYLILKLSDTTDVSKMPAAYCYYFKKLK